MKFAQEFKDFASKGNVVDLAVGVIVGASFGKVVTSLVNDVLMPPIGKLMGEVNFTDLFINLSPHQRLPNGDRIISLAQAKAAGAAVVAYGQFVNAVLDFFIVALSVFALVKLVGTIKRRLGLELSAASPANKEEKLLGEIRDLLKADRDAISSVGRASPRAGSSVASPHRQLVQKPF